jgi:hypothetical protein
MIVSLTGVSNAQVLTLSTSGGSVSPAIVPLGFLAGDTNGNRTVNSSDVSQTKGQLGQAVTGSNFRTDVNAGGSITSTDVSLIKQNLATALP